LGRSTPDLDGDPAADQNDATLTVPDPDLLLPLAVLLPFAAAGLVVVLGRTVGRRAGWIVLAAALGSTAALVPAARTPAVDGFAMPWMPTIGVQLAFRGDGFGLLLAFLVAGIGALVAFYALGYMADEDPTRVRRFWAALAAFMGSMLGIALADDLILLFVFWEMTSVTSFLLIGYRSEDDDAKDGALVALQVTALGGLAMSVGFLVIGQVTGTFSISRIAASPALVAALRDSPLSTGALVLVLLGAFTKSAQVPFHFWLPAAMVAPTPVSAYLHAATMVKAGVFLLGRMHPLFGEAPLWAPTLVVVGTVSMVLGAYQAFAEVDLKAILARTTASALGTITLLYGLGLTGADSLALLNHALYKGALFLVAGIVEHHAHTRRLDQLGGLGRALPIAFVTCAVASLSMAGFPPLLGFVAKDAFYAELLEAPFLVERPLLHAAVVAASLATSALLVAVAAKLTLGVFLGRRPPHGPAKRHAGGVPLWPSPALLAAGALGLGLASLGHFTSDLVAATASGRGDAVHVSLVPPLGIAFYTSLLALGLGGVVYAMRDPLAALQTRLARLPAASDVWDTLIGAVVRLAEVYSARWQNGSLRWYLAVTVLALPALAGWALAHGDLSWRHVGTHLAEMPWYGFLFCVLLAVATMIAVRARTRLTAAIATTTIGFLVAMLFVVYRSPDILLTQILIETVSTIFVLLVLVFLPAFRKEDLPAGSRLVNLGIAAAFGLTMTLLILLAMTPGLREPDNISVRPGGLLSLALAEGGGQNAVNVIIVDIRAMDTTGEIAVLVVVGLCVYGLLRSRRRATARRLEGTHAAGESP
jgi:NADH:ubiquinone oxidoreductase subunit 5 (subunit L)/multisubunit Na+/H+ antiporter MnhA subunit/multisubunit Na+/H+ antiporter MnhB subunit